MNRISFALLSLLALTAPVPAIAQGPPEVAGLRFDPDGITNRSPEEKPCTVDHHTVFVADRRRRRYLDRAQ